MSMSCQGAILDSDLATYAQGMAGAAHPELFAEDPVLHSQSAANSIRNLERTFAEWLSPKDAYAIGLMRAGALTIVLFYLSWYIFGRWLFHKRSAALLLTAAVSITVWIGFGTFWGITHSDPLPRVFHAAIWPWMLMLCMIGYERASVRPLAMLGAGLGMWLHGVSALATGAMFFVAFFFHRTKGQSVLRHLLSSLLWLVCFFVPVLLFLAPSLFQARAFNSEELAAFQQLFVLRWHEDYGNILGDFLTLFRPDNAFALLVYGGLVSSLFFRAQPDSRLARLARMLPSFLLAIACVCFFSLLETRYAPDFGRVPMGHELVRAIKFLVPLAWIFLTGLCVWLLELFPRPLATCCAIIAFVAIFCLSSDKQYCSVRYALSQWGLELPQLDQARALHAQAESARQALDALSKHVKIGEAVFCLEDSMMAIRYATLRPLVYSFKDGYVHYYNKDVQATRTWLAYTKLVQAGELSKALEKSHARWYLTRSANLSPLDWGRVVWQNASWVLLQRN
ncbi:MAG: translation initiation factor 2 [Desulfovibrio sp.]|nr:translation initiation factor 2 [Desulfovibrio sp.]